MSAGAERPPSALVGVGSFDRYRIEGELGRGGMGAVYRAVEAATQRVVALKTLASHEPKLIALFERE